MKKVGKFIKIVAINLAILFVLLIIVDPFFKSDERSNEEGKTYRALNMREFGPNRNFVLDGTTFPDSKDDSLDHQFYTLVTDEKGFIVGPDDELDLTPDVIFFGGSTTECMFVDDSLRFPYLVQRALRNNLDPNIVVRNAGFGGNHSMHSLINFIGNGLVYQPKMVVLMHNSNDLSQLSKTGSYWNAPANRSLLKKDFVPSEVSFSSRIQKLKKALIDVTIPNIARKLYQMKRAKLAGQDEWKGMRSEEFVGFEAVSRQYRSSLETFVKTAKAHHIPVVIMTQFNRIQHDDRKIDRTYAQFKNPIKYNEFVEYYQAFNDIVRDIAKQENVFLIDLDQAIPHHKKYLIDAVHLNNAGSRLVSEVVSDSLANFLVKVDILNAETPNP